MIEIAIGTSILAEIAQKIGTDASPFQIFEYLPKKSQYV